VYETGEPVISVDASRDPRFDLARSVHALHIEGVMSIPVHARGKVVGVLYLEGDLGAAAMDDVRLVMAFADQAAVLLDGARLRAELARRADELGAARSEIETLLAERTELLERRTDELTLARRDLAAVHRKFLGSVGAFGIVGRSAAMERVFTMIDRVAASDVPVLVLGESGTGKELVARALHHHGPRRDATLVSVNCAGVPETLLESELYGHVRGAFTGADRTRRGVFESASGGTLFLDEVGEMPARMQGSLLRALQERVIRRVGDTRDIAVDIRVVAATHRALDRLVQTGVFREDLYYRLHVVPIEVPALRERREDIPLLCDHFLAAIAARTTARRKQVTRRAMKLLCDHAWPGNVRQLEHALTNACVLAETDVLDLADFAGLSEVGRVGRAAGGVGRRDRERARMVDALEACAWNKSKAARLLDMPRRTFYRRLAEYDIE
jgi:DNA-binding NtrC family response regulator